MFRKRALTLTLAGLLLSACAHKKQARNPPPPPSRPSAAPAVVGSTENGIASWYGHPYDGRRAADGETYDMETLVAAHRTLPFNTWVRVYNLNNNKTVDVRIIDRGPFVDGRIIDLSHAAAQAIDMIGPGVAQVRLEIISSPASVAPAVFGVQVGAYLNRANAERMRAQMQARYGNAQVVLEKGYWRVFVGHEATEAGANGLAARILQDSPEKKDAFVVRLDLATT
jgi:rare lipoprotein A